jgi:hypothetical protein
MMMVARMPRMMTTIRISTSVNARVGVWRARGRVEGA